MKKDSIKILVMTVSSWNSKIGANSWATFLDSYNSENISSICIREEKPDSKICSRYFVVSENRIIKSLFNKKIKTGYEITSSELSEDINPDLDEHNARYKKMSKKRNYFLLLIREIIWKLGKWKTNELDKFLDDVKPDVILHSMEGYIHLNRITQYAIKKTGAKAVGYIWDDNFTYKQSNKWGYKLYRFFQRMSLRKLAKMTDEFFAISDMTKEEADNYFNIDCHLLTKPLNSTPIVNYDKINDKIRMLYTGNLYIGRDNSLLKVINAIERTGNTSFFIDVYTHTQLQETILNKINPDICCIHPPISQEEVLKKQKKAGILLFLEDIDGVDSNVARLSFSTKVTDYLSSGRCIFAIGNKETAPMQYFIKNNAALVAGSEQEIVNILESIVNSPEIIVESAKITAKIGIQNHNKEKIQSIFDTIIFGLFKK